MLVVWNKKTKKVVAAQSRHPNPVRIDEIKKYDPNEHDYAEVDDSLLTGPPDKVVLDDEGKVVRIDEDKEAVQRIEQSHLKSLIVASCQRLAALRGAQRQTGIDLSAEISEERDRLSKFIVSAKEKGVTFATIDTSRRPSGTQG